MSDLFAWRRAFMQQFDIVVPQVPCFDFAAMAPWHTMLAEEWQGFQQAANQPTAN